MKLTGAEITIKLLEDAGVKVIAGIPGGSNLPLYNALYKSNINHILARHEQGAGFIAQGMARSSNEVGVCFATSGPGATNLVTALADAMIDSIPIIAITGQVPYPMIGTDAFQEIDIYGMTLPITKHNYLISNVEELFYVIPRAFEIALEGRPGPVLIDIPKDIQNQIYEIEEWPEFNITLKKSPSPSIEKLEKIASIINNAKQPLIYAGGGVKLSNTSSLVSELSHKNSIPTVLTLMALDTLRKEDPLNLGMLGMHGQPYTNYLVDKADVIIVLGARFDDRATGLIGKFCENATIIHIDIDGAEINKLKSTHISISCSLDAFLTSIIPLIDKNPREDWLNTINEYKNDFKEILPPKEDKLHAVNIIKTISSLCSDDTIVTTDVGQHQMWVAQHFSFKGNKTFLTSGGLGTMGFGVPAAIGAALKNPAKDVMCFTGDGSILMNIQELATIKDHNLNVKIIILNNHHLGLVRQQQELFYDNNIMASKFISNPDFTIIAKGFGIEAIDILEDDTLEQTLERTLTKKGPLLININIKEDDNVLPMVPPGKENTVMIIE
ncbi:MAG: biosynthetic-type acetolactate synthase large subunit [Clostridium sp.]